jgi:hypothetical protein
VRKFDWRLSRIEQRLAVQDDEANQVTVAIWRRWYAGDTEGIPPALIAEMETGHEERFAEVEATLTMLEDEVCE